jgi:hypothetical protein
MTRELNRTGDQKFGRSRRILFLGLLISISC